MIEKSDLDQLSENDDHQDIVECVKARLQKEGREARNLIAYSLPLNNPKSVSKISKDLSDTCNPKKFGSALPKTVTPVKRRRSASAGRDPQACLRARHWGFLFRNLQQAVDEIYQTCEVDESIIECKEATMMLERYANDFYKLIEWLKLKWEYENTPPLQRPNSLTWEIRTSSSGKIFKSSRKSVSRSDESEKCKKYSNFTMNPSYKKESSLILSMDKIEERETLVIDEKNSERAVSLKNLTKVKTSSILMKKDLNLSRMIDGNKIISKRPVIKGPSKDKESLPLETKDIIKSSSNSIMELELKDKLQPDVIGSVLSQKENTISEVGSSNFNENSKSSTHQLKKSNDHHSKIIHNKPVPLVNMNKASQVRQAFNQSKTPLKAPCCNSWKISNGSNYEQLQGLTRSSTTLEGSQINKRSWKKMPERSFCLDDKYQSDCSLASSSNTSSSVQSWADKVRGGTVSVKQDSSSSLRLQDDDNEGWEVVKRGRRSYGGSSASLNSQTPPNSAHGHKDKIRSKKDPNYRAKTRYQKPTSSRSMPSLFSSKETNIEKDEPMKKSTSSKKICNEYVAGKSTSVKQKSSSPHSEKCRKDASNLSKKNETRSYHLSSCGSVEEEVTCSKKEQFCVDEKLDNMVKATSESLLDSNRESEDKTTSLIDKKPESCTVIKMTEEFIDKEEEEKMIDNAAALESAVNEEKRLKYEIEETERDALEECEGMEEERCQETASAKIAIHEEEFYHYDSKYAKFSSLSWAEEMDAVERIEFSRLPGRVLHIHEKLSSPSRKLPISEKYRRHKEKLAKAQEQREKLMKVKAEKLHNLFRRISEVNIDKERLLVEKRNLFNRKMERAEEKRRLHLKDIIAKAHDEDNKAKEIAFINSLEAQNKLHDIMQLQQIQESRLIERAEERCRRQEEKAAKEAAAQERRKALEAERVARMAELCEKRRRQSERIDRLQAERREELLEQAKEKAREREERLIALQQAQLAKESELVKKIQQKQEETARRHEENIEQIRQKALESSIMKFSRGCDDAPKLLKYEKKKLCTLCNSLIASEVYLSSHLRGKQHREALKALHKRDVTLEESESCNIKFITDAPANADDPQDSRDKERKKVLKKRCRKIRSRMVSRAEEYLKSFIAPTCKEAPLKLKTKRALAQICKIFSNQGSGPWPTSDVTMLDRHLLELLRILENSSTEERVAFASLGGFKRLWPILGLITANEGGNELCVVPSKSLSFCARVLLSACRQSKDNCTFLLLSNVTVDLVDCIMKKFNQISRHSISDSTVAALMELLAEVLKVMSELTKDKDRDQRMQDLVSYCVSIGITDKITWYFNHTQDPIDNDPLSAQIIIAAMSLLSALAGTISSKAKGSDPTQLIMTFQVMEACGVVSLMYGSLLHQGGRSESPPSEALLSTSTLSISEAATSFLYNLAALDLNMFQLVLGSEGISLEFRHICSFLLWYCSKWPCEDLLHNVISLVGFFTINNKENQSVVQSGETPSVLQQLCSLPWQYFSEPKLIKVLFPTLLSCCLHNEDNLVILQQEISFQVLDDFLHGDDALDHHLMKILRLKL